MTSDPISLASREVRRLMRRAKNDAGGASSSDVGAPGFLAIGNLPDQRPTTASGTLGFGQPAKEFPLKGNLTIQTFWRESDPSTAFGTVSWAGRNHLSRCWSCQLFFLMGIFGCGSNEWSYESNAAIGQPAARSWQRKVESKPSFWPKFGIAFLECGCRLWRSFFWVMLKGFPT